MFKKILLFGTQGQLGWELQRTLALLGPLVGLDYPQIDLSDYNSVPGWIEEVTPDLIVNAAAYTNVDKAESEPEKARAINALAVAKMAQTAARLGIGLVHYSTDYVFDGTKGTPYVENDSPNPLNVYGVTKLEGERAVQAEAAPYWVFRTSWVYSNRVGGFVNKVLQWAHNREVVRVVDDQISSPTWARLLAEATALALVQGRDDPLGWMKGTSGLYHLAGGGYCSRYEWAQEIIKNDPQPEKQVLRELLPAKTGEFPTPAQRPLFSGMSVSLYNNVFSAFLPTWVQSVNMYFEGVGKS